MAVVQISRIQVRRGQKNSNSGVPQLSSAEFAWAVDSQELYIGNGSVAEGAPYVGNTKILTEHDNILELTAGYSFGQGDPAITRSIARSLQSKLDETVSVVDYGAVPDGSTDCTLAFEAAFADLFDSVDTDNRKILLVPNGRYSFNLPARPLRIPSWATLQGENSSQTVLDIGNSGIEFVKGNSEEYPRDITIANLTIEHGDGQTDITASRHCEFENVTWKSDYQLSSVPVFEEENANAVYLLPIVSIGGNIQVDGTGVSSTVIVGFSTNYQFTLSSLVGILNADSVFQQLFVATVSGTSLKVTVNNSANLASTISSGLTVSAQPDNETSSLVVEPILTEFQDGSQLVQASVFWNNQSFSTRTTDHAFKNCKFTNTRLGVECQQQSLFDTEIAFVDCRFSVCDTAMYIGGVPTVNSVSQGNFWNISDCKFESIANQAFVSTFGIGTRFNSTEFKNCGNGVATAEFPVTAIVKFGETFNNVLINCSSNRHQASAVTELPAPTKAAVVEFENVSSASLIDKNYANIFVSDSARSLAVLPVENRFVEVDYYLSLGNHSRKGKLIIAVGSANNTANTAIQDEYIYSSLSPTAPGGALMTNFEFSAAIETVASKPTVVLNYKNPIDDGNGTVGTISYSLTYGN